MSIQINGFDGKPNKALADDAVCAVFVAEAVDLPMTYQNIKTKKTTWHPGRSDGEELSRVSMELLYFEAAYQLIGAPYVNTWMQSSKRPDFISKNQTTDENATSYGCAMLFIHYLYSQLGFSLPAIINKAGGTLEKTYHALTGKNGGYKAFTKLLAKFFPIGDTPLLPFDNPFPLLAGKARDVYVTATESQASPPEGSTSGTATFNACGSGPTSNYEWTLTDQNVRRMRAQVQRLGTSHEECGSSFLAVDAQEAADRLASLGDPTGAAKAHRARASVLNSRYLAAICTSS